MLMVEYVQSHWNHISKELVRWLDLSKDNNLLIYSAA
jgi:hypothetical protein